MILSIEIMFKKYDFTPNSVDVAGAEMGKCLPRNCVSKTLQLIVQNFIHADLLDFTYPHPNSE